MSKKIDDGGEAFPIPGMEHGPVPPTPGMSLRDWFAGQALALINYAGLRSTSTERAPINAARMAYELADAMIAQRKKGPEDE